MVIVKGNEAGYFGSNPERGCLLFNMTLIPLRKVLSPIYEEISRVGWAL